MTHIQTQYVVVGGGMVGTAMALGLARMDKRVVLLEAFPASPYESSQVPDSRMSALAQASVEFLTDLGAWSAIESKRTRPYTALAVWDHPLARTEFHAQDIGADRLGVFVENRITQLGLSETLLGYENCSIIHAKAVTSDARTGVVVCDNGVQIKAQYIIAADGVHSGIRKAAEIATQGWQYGQQALGITIQTHYATTIAAKTAQQMTWQQFTPSGPLAFLPMHEDYASLVWYDTPERIAHLTALSHSELHDEIVQHFPKEVGEFSVLNATSFPLTRMHAVRYIKHKVTLIGDAAHAINPLAGQGVNLGFQDVKCLLDVIMRDGDWINEYEKPRQRANLLMMSAMDAFYVTFSNDNPLLKAVRNVGLFAADKGGKLKHAVMKKAMGI